MKYPFRTIFLFGILLLIAVGCQQNTSLPETPFRDVPLQEMYGVKMQFSQDGIVRSKVRSAKVVQMKEGEPTKLSGGVTLYFLDSLGNRSGFMLSKRAEVDEFRSYYIATGDVYLWSDTSEVALETQSLRWDPPTRKIITNDSVRIATQQDTLYGIGLIADENLTFWEIMQPMGKSYRELQQRERKPDPTRRR
ncbi:MAG: hypothetical protein OEM52_10200 [bacterium]|nr:hypothetical protein [bacterium]